MERCRICLEQRATLAGHQCSQQVTERLYDLVLAYEALDAARINMAKAPVARTAPFARAVSEAAGRVSDARVRCGR